MTNNRSPPKSPIEQERAAINLPKRRRSRGWFRISKRRGDEWDVIFKNFHSDVAIDIAREMSYDNAHALKEALNDLLATVDPDIHKETDDG